MGYVVLFGSLIGFCQYRTLTDRFKYVVFPSWLRKKGCDPTKYRQNMGMVRSYEFLSNSSALKKSKKVFNFISHHGRVQAYLSMHVSWFTNHKCSIGPLLTEEKAVILVQTLKSGKIVLEGGR